MGLYLKRNRKCFPIRQIKGFKKSNLHEKITFYIRVATVFIELKDKNQFISNQLNKQIIRNVIAIQIFQQRPHQTEYPNFLMKYLRGF